MATTGRLTAAQRTAIAAGAPIRQVWQIEVPGDTLHIFWATYDLDDGIFPIPAADTMRRVTRAGSRKHTVWNPSPNVLVKPKAVRYQFEVDNSDGIFYETHPDNVYQIVGLYQAKPQECRIYHRLYVGEPGTIYNKSYLWTEITHMKFRGVIRSVRYEDISDSQGNPVPGKAIIVCEQLGAWDALRRKWGVDDARVHDMTDDSTFNFTWTVT